MNRVRARTCTFEVVAVAAAAMAGALPVHGQTVLTVNAADDVSDGACDVTHCSLREAILAANGTDGTISFDIAGAGPHVIQPTSPLPVLTGSVVLDGTSEPGYVDVPVVVLDGTLAGAAHGLQLVGTGSTVRGLAIGGFALNGIDVTSGTSGHVIAGNHIGTDASGTVARPNGHGIHAFNTTDNVIGGTSPEDRNVISGNTLHGVEISGSLAADNRILGNYIGVDATGASPLGNGWSGVQLTTAPDNVVGSTDPGGRNVLSANGQNGIAIVDPPASGNLVVGNYLGTDVTGTIDLGNVERGVAIYRASGNVIGGTEDGARNVISGNDASGVYISNAGGGGTSSENVVVGNYVGTSPDGLVAVGNRIGVQLFGGSGLVQGNEIGGTETGAGNVISGNETTGFLIQGAGATGNRLLGNLIGTDASGASALGNGGSGVFLGDESRATIVGGGEAGAPNVISANVNGMTVTSSDNVILGNYIGVDAAGVSALGNMESGIRVLRDAADNAIGGAAAGAGNVISGNGDDGIRIFQNQGTPVRTTVRGNRIGTDADGTGSIPNLRHGVLVQDAPDHAIGGPGAGDGNVIASNGAHGVSIESGGGNSVLGNSIHGNDGLGIALGPIGTVVENDADDSDTGANDLLNFPELGPVYPGSAELSGTFQGASGTALRVELFASDLCDPSGHGEGARLLGSTDVTTGTDGSADLSVDLAAALGLGEVVTATATDVDGSTSGFSACRTASDFALSSAESALTVPRGGSGQTTLSVASVGGRFDGTVELTCDGLAGNASCSFSSASVMPEDDEATVTLTVSAPETTATAPSPRVPPPVAVLALLSTLAWLARPSPARARTRRLAVAACAGVSFLAACRDSPTDVPDPIELTLTVTAASGPLSHETTIDVRIE